MLMLFAWFAFFAVAPAIHFEPPHVGCYEPRPALSRHFVYFVVVTPVFGSNSPTLHFS
jgi:hypothetical protein